VLDEAIEEGETMVKAANGAQVNAYLDKDTWLKFCALAEKTGKSRSSLIREIIQEYFTEKEARMKQGKAVSQKVVKKS